MTLLEKAKLSLLENEYEIPIDTIDNVEESHYFDGKGTLIVEKLTKQVISQSLGYSIVITTKTLEEESFPLGASKIGGNPHLPDNLQWPKNHQFIAQLNIAEFKHLDIEDLFPDKGIFYFFMNPDVIEGTVLFNDASIIRLNKTKSADTKLDSKSACQLNYASKIIFYIKDLEYDLYLNADELIPETLIEELETLLRCKFTTIDSACHLLGRPTFWQSEDVEYNRRNHTHHQLQVLLGSQPISMKVDKRVPQEGHDRVLLFQTDYNEGSIHFWVNKKDLQLGAFTKAYMTYSGT